MLENEYGLRASQRIFNFLRSDLIFLATLFFLCKHEIVLLRRKSNLLCGKH